MPSISFAYGYAPARRVLRRRRAQELLAGGRAPRRHAAGRVAAGAVAREAARHAAARPLRPPRRADGGGSAPLPRARSGCSSLEEQLVDEVAGESEGELTGELSIGASTGPAAIVVPHPAVRVPARAPGRPRLADRFGHAVRVDLVAAARARARHRRSRAPPPLPFASSRSSRTRSSSPARPAIPSPAARSRIDELRAEQLIVMQEGAGVRQIVEDELRALGIRLRDLDVRLELGLQESVRSAVQAGYGVTFISRSAVESDLAAGTLVAARVEGLDATREISLARTSGRTSTRAADAFVEFARGRSCDRPLGTRTSCLALAGRAAVPRRERALARSRRGAARVDRGAVAPDRGARRRRRRSSRSAAAAPSTRPRPPRQRAGCRSSPCPTTYSGAEWTRVLRRARPGPADAGRRRGRAGCTGSSTSPSSRWSCPAPRPSARR